MTDIATNFPPQTYSSSFFLNSLSDGEKKSKSKGADRPKDLTASSSPFLDCFIKTFLSGEKGSAKEQQSKEVHNLSSNKSNEKDLEVVDFWKTRHGKSASRTDSPPKSTFKKWRKSSATKTGDNNQQQQLKEARVNNGIGNAEEKPEEDKSLLKFLALNALDLSAPASDVLLKSRSSNWFQLSGHPDSLAPAGPGTVWKKRSGGSDDTERTVYEELSKDDLINDIIPKYYREVEYQGEKFIELQDLLHEFDDPYVIDIKMGTRTFLESEVQKTNARQDLYQKMVAIDPSAPTPEEHERGAVTKLRYMQFRELQSSSSSHGFRIEAMKCRGSAPVTDLKTVKSKEEVRRTMDTFVGGRTQVKERLLRRLAEIRGKLERSEYFRGHEVVGSSVFMIYDDRKVGVWLIDFAKTNKLPDGVTVNHRDSWTQGNHEEGLLFGFDQLIDVIDSVRTSTAKNEQQQQQQVTIPTKPLLTVSVNS